MNVASLWYFNKFDFLRDQESQIQRYLTMEENKFIGGINETQVHTIFIFSIVYLIHLNTNSLSYKTIIFHSNSNLNILSCQETAPWLLLKKYLFWKVCFCLGASAMEVIVHINANADL